MALAACKLLLVMCVKKDDRSRSTYRLELLRRNTLVALGEVGSKDGLRPVDKAGPNGDEGLAGIQGVELSLADSLGHILLAERASRNTLERLGDLLGGLADRSGSTGELDGQKAGVGVLQVGGRAGNARLSGNLRDERETRRPLDARLAAKESREDGHLRSGRAGAGAGEGDNNRVAVLEVNALLATVVGGGRRLHAKLAGGGSGDVAEESVGPLAEARLGGAVGNNSDVGLRVGTLGELGKGVLIDVAVRGRRKRGVQGRAEAVVVGKAVGGVEGDGSGIPREPGLLDLDHPLDILLELMG